MRWCEGEGNTFLHVSHVRSASVAFTPRGMSSGGEKAKEKKGAMSRFSCFVFGWVWGAVILSGLGTEGELYGAIGKKGRRFG